MPGLKGLFLRGTYKNGSMLPRRVREEKYDVRRKRRLSNTESRGRTHSIAKIIGLLSLPPESKGEGELIVSSLKRRE